MPRRGHKSIPGPTNVQNVSPIVTICSIVDTIAKKKRLWRTLVASKTRRVRHKNTYLRHFGVALWWQGDLLTPRNFLATARLINQTLPYECACAHSSVWLWVVLPSNCSGGIHSSYIPARWEQRWHALIVHCRGCPHILVTHARNSDSKLDSSTLVTFRRIIIGTWPRQFGQAHSLCQPFQKNPATNIHTDTNI